MFQRRSVRWSVAAAIAAVVVLTIGLWPGRPGSRPSGGVAWAQVLENISVFRPYSCLYTWEYEGQPPQVYREMRPSLSRRREVFPDGTVRVFDLSRTPNVVLTLPPESKLAERQVLLGTEPRQDPDFLRILAGMRAGTAEDLGVKEVEGRLARGFHRPDKLNEFTIWADDQTGLPIRVELVQPSASRRLVMSEFQFDAVLDESLFDIDAPADYQVRTVEVDGINPTEQHLIEALREIATFLGGEFPSNLGAIESSLQARAQNMQPPPAEEEIKDLRMKAQRVQRFLQIQTHLRGAKDLTYSGQGVALGDADTPILRWTPKDSPTRVIYGDLSARDLSPEESQ